ncbi:hypothetical protein ACIRP5_07410 [Streptomyces sp. NPDC101221]|uniref:hypothetical protein n=1 Tax=Streptomyces sp. NPDC101221 TaxID=3366132 RepID=UPI0037F2BB07
MLVITAFFAWILYFWYFALRALFAGGSCGSRYGTACGSGTGWNIWIVTLLFPVICISISVLNNGIYRPERLGHEFYRMVLAVLPVVALADLFVRSDFGFWTLPATALCLALLAVVGTWTVRTVGLRGSFWLMKPERITALGADPAVRTLSTTQNVMFLAANSVGAASGGALAWYVSDLIG